MSTSASHHTIVLSDLHLADAQPLDPRRPLWKRFKRADLFIDQSFGLLIDHLLGTVDGPAELVLDGDIFDFDSVLTPSPTGKFQLSWLERRRGLAAEEAKSAWKMEVILADHHVWAAALRRWLDVGHKIVFVIGNHDLELHWGEVQQVLRRNFGMTEDPLERLRFCEFFYVSGQDTTILHGNQYDRYCLCQDPINPLVSVRGKPRIRLPFGNVAGKLMLNGMGLFNPHVESSFIKPLGEYLRFFYRYVLRVQPLLLLTWLWTAIATLLISVGEGLRPALRDPLMLEERFNQVATRANSVAGVVRTLRAVEVHSAIFNPWMVARELWLDRAALLALVAVLAWQFFTTLNVFADVSAWWFFGALAVLLPPFIFYARTVSSDVDKVERAIHERVPLLARITGVKRVVMGHTHIARHEQIEGVEYLNTGTWSPAFDDVECTQPSGQRCICWVRPAEGLPRQAALHTWDGAALTPLHPGGRDRRRKTVLGKLRRGAKGVLAPLVKERHL